MILMASDTDVRQTFHTRRSAGCFSQTRKIPQETGRNLRDDPHDGNAEPVVETHHALGALRRPAQAVPQAVEVSLAGSHVGRQPGPKKAPTSQKNELAGRMVCLRNRGLWLVSPLV